MSFLNSHIASRCGESSLQTSDFLHKSVEKQTSNIMDIITESSMDKLEYIDMQNLVNNKNNDACDNNCSSATSNSSKSSLIQRNSKKRRTSLELSSDRSDFWKNASEAIKNLSNNKENIQDGLHFWILHVESELRKKDKKRLKYLKVRIMSLIDSDDSE
ncbi:uncharacterized protein [Prorops nasuta]|uniref:uncharacterized protein n=1 Tax=Prorops nasuta TaxID=863751 RepID=UPI0034CD914A